MLRVYSQQETPIYLNKRAAKLFNDGVECFHSLGLATENVIQQGTTIHIIPWLGDRIANTISVLLRGEGLLADDFGGIIDIRDCNVEILGTTIDTILQKPKPSPEVLAGNIEDTIVEKHDPVLSKELRELSYGTRFFDTNGAWLYLQSLKIST